MSLRHYLPRAVVGFLDTKPQDVELSSPESHSFNSIVLFADVSGFTNLTEQLSKRGNSSTRNLGTEELATRLNSYMSQIVRETTKAGGDVIKFAGDAMVAVFEVMDENIEQELINLSHVATRASLKMQENPFISNYSFKFNPEDEVYDDESEDENETEKGSEKKPALIKKTVSRTEGSSKTPAKVKSKNAGKFNKRISASRGRQKDKSRDKLLRDIMASKRNLAEQDKDRFKLEVKFGIASGVVNIVHIGGQGDSIVLNRYEYLAVGPALTDAFEAESFCNPGEVVVTDRIKKKLSKTKLYKFSKIKKQTAFYLVKMNESNNKNFEIPDAKIRKYSDNHNELMWGYVPAAVMPFIRENYRRFESWLSELRRVTTLFCDIGLDADTMDGITRGDPLAQLVLQEVFKHIQDKVFKYEGVINKFLVDDKGNTLIVVFGLAPHSHDDDASRGVRCGMEIMDYLKGRELRPAMGITTGVCYCGVIGHTSGRREYSVIGDCINLAARLMSLAKKNNERVQVSQRQALYVELSTRVSIRDKRLVQEFIKSRESVKLKGKSDKVWYFMPDVETKQILKTFTLNPKFETNRLAIVYVYPDSNSEEVQTTIDDGHHVSSVRQTIIIEPGDTVGKIRAKSIQKLNNSEITKENKFWQFPVFQVTPEDSLTPGKLLSNKQPLEYISPELKVIYFKLEFSRKEHPPASIIKDNSAFYKPRITSPAKNKDFTTEDPFSILGRFEEVKRQCTDGFKVVFVEGTYGVGRSFAVKQSFLDSNAQNMENISTLSTVADPFLNLNETGKYGDVWVNLIRQLMDKKLAELKVPNDRMEKIKAKNRIIKAALEAAGKVFEVCPTPDSADKENHRYDKRQLAVLNELLGCAFRTTGVTRKKDTIVFSKNDMDAIFEKDPVLASKSMRARSMMIESEPQNSFVSDAGISQGSEVIIKLLSAIFVGLCPKDSGSIIVIDDSHHMDPYSWLILLELAEWWQAAKITVVLSHRKVAFESANDFSGNTKGGNVVPENNLKIDDVLPFKEDSIKGEFMRTTRISTQRRFTSNSKRSNSKASKDESNGKIFLTESYTEADQIQDRMFLIEKLRALKNSYFYEVCARPELTEDIICNILEVEDPPKLLVDYLTKKTKGNPLYIDDAIRLFQKESIIAIERHDFTTNSLIFNEGKFKKHKNTVPASIENVAGMLLDNMSIFHQVALKVASLIPGDTFTISQVKELFPMDNITPEMEKKWKQVEYKLVSSSIIEVVRNKESENNEKVYTFMNPWMQTSMQRRILEKQKHEVKMKLPKLKL